MITPTTPTTFSVIPRIVFAAFSFSATNFDNVSKTPFKRIYSFMRIKALITPKTPYNSGPNFRPRKTCRMKLLKTKTICAVMI